MNNAKKILLIAGGIFTTLLVCFILTIIYIFANGIGFYTMEGMSMDPTITSGKNLVVHSASEIKRSDIAVYKNKSGQILIHRIIAVPGDQVEFTADGQVMINGAVEPKDWVEAREDKSIPQTFIPDGSTLSVKFVVPADEYLTLGDNRQNAVDSRYFGLVEKEKIQSIMWFKY